MASKAKLIYFKGRGLADIVRFTLAAAGVEFEDVFVTEREQFLKLIEDGDLLFNQVPLLIIDGMKLVQSAAIAKYIAHKHGLMGKSPQDSAMVDMLFEGYRDFIGLGFKLICFKKTEEEKKQLTEFIKSRARDQYLPIFDKVYKQSTSGYLVGDSMTLADISWLAVLLWLHEVEPEFSVTFPSIAAFTGKMMSLPRISTFVNGPQRHPQPDEEYINSVIKVLNRDNF